MTKCPLRGERDAVAEARPQNFLVHSQLDS